MKEFNKEVTMLDKFCDPYIVHFYGAVFTPYKICMVTEFAEIGSLKDLMRKIQNSPINEEVRIKMLLDAAKGIEYLHNNGILRRDIKSDNILLFDIEHNDNSFINVKLTEFGSVRNLKMSMTNMSFTNGIGTPIYKATEVFNRQHYKKPSDIYSFALTMYEYMKCGDAYQKEQFQHPWNNAYFDMKGDRLTKSEDVKDEMYELITQ